MDLDHLDGATVYFIVIMITLFITACAFWIYEKRKR